MICLGIESTAHTFGVGIVDGEKILSNERSMYIPKKGSGIIPKEAAMHHSDVSSELIRSALKGAGLKVSDIDLISFSQGPGLPQCLRVGAVVARTLSLRCDLPLISVNHCVAHIEIGKLTTRSKDPVVLYLSGGNTQVIAHAGGRYRVFGETQDIPIGNALDNLARGLDLEMPGGPNIEALARGGKYIELPYVVKGMDLSFSGLTTESIKRFKNGESAQDISYSFQETCFAMLAEVTERAMAHTDKEELLLVGGVAANKRLQEMLSIMCSEREAKMFVVPQEYAGDQGAMIAWTGLLAKKRGYEVPISKSQIRQRWRVDDLDW
jgi:N6-L-threonylcarbamoyladenine synthase